MSLISQWTCWATEPLTSSCGSHLFDDLPELLWITDPDDRLPIVDLEGQGNRI